MLLLLSTVPVLAVAARKSVSTASAHNLNSIPLQVRPIKEQPFYHLLAEAPGQPSYVAYVSQQNLLRDDKPGPLVHPLIDELFNGIKNGKYISRSKHN